MVKIRLKRFGYKKNPTYRIIVIDSRSKREGAPIEELGHYNPKTKEMKLNKTQAVAWIQKGAQATETVSYLIKNCNDDGTLKYEKKKTEKLSKKALAKIETEKKAKEEAAKKPAEPVVEVATEEAPAAVEAVVEEAPVVEVVEETAPAVEVEAAEEAVVEAPAAEAEAVPEATTEEVAADDTGEAKSKESGD